MADTGDTIAVTVKHRKERHRVTLPTDATIGALPCSPCLHTPHPVYGTVPYARARAAASTPSPPLPFACSRVPPRAIAPGAVDTGALTAAVHQWSGIEPDRQKLMAKGGKKLNTLDPSTALVAVGLDAGRTHTVLLVGSTAAKAAAAAVARADAAASAKVVDDMQRRASKYAVSAASRRRPRTSKYRFESINPLPGLPDEGKARAVLQRLAEDPGVVAVMEVRARVCLAFTCACARKRA